MLGAMSRGIFRLFLIAGCVGAVALGLRPLHDGILRFGLPLFLAMAWAGALGLLWRRPLGRFLAGLLPVFVATPFLLPAKPLDAGHLRAAYVANLRSFKGTPYLWGGESKAGIDCSGLPRRALRDALLAEGLTHLNGAALRAWVEQWWFDSSAQAMGETYRGRTRRIGITGRLRDLDFTRLNPGDLAATANGIHVMVYLGGGEWIQADPGPAKVIVGKPASDPNVWFDSEVVVCRWTVFDGLMTPETRG